MASTYWSFIQRKMYKVVKALGRENRVEIDGVKISIDTTKERIERIDSNGQIIYLYFHYFKRVINGDAFASSLSKIRIIIDEKHYWEIDSDSIKIVMRNYSPLAQRIELAWSSGERKRENRGDLSSIFIKLTEKNIIKLDSLAMMRPDSLKYLRDFYQNISDNAETKIALNENIDFDEKVELLMAIVGIKKN